MKERPILFSAPMVRALLDGSKTQTRRVVNRLKGFGQITEFGRGDTPGYDWHFRDKAMRWHDVSTARAMAACPYGVPGDRLWVRESWAPDPVCDGTWPYTEWAGCRDGQIAGVPDRFRHPRFCNYAANWLHEPVRWTPSIHMPRWASRIDLEVTGVRVERLQDISEADARAEGASFHDGQGIGHSGWRHDHGDVHADARSAYARLWESINGAGSWEGNPYVWVVEFKRIKP